MRVLIDGVAVPDLEATLSVFDWAVIRGFGVFEVIRSYGGTPFRLAGHLDRLERSAAALGLGTPRREMLESWVRDCTEAGGDCQVRVVVTGGGRDQLVPAPPRTVVMWEPIPDIPETLKVLPMVAPWHPATDAGGFAGVKWTSYAPNMASTDKAKQAGYDDALLLSADSTVLEGPTYTVAWFSQGRLETPATELGILASITREAVLEAAGALGIEVKQGIYPLDRIAAAAEVLAMSTTREVVPVGLLGQTPLPSGPLTEQLRGAFHRIVRDETGT